MRIPFVDLHAQYLTIKEEIDRAIGEVIAESAYIRGPHVDAFEQVWARYANQYRILSLPVCPEIPDEAIKEVASEIKNALKLTSGRPRSQAVAEPILNRI